MKGTINQLCEKITLNGEKLSQPEMNIMLKYAEKSGSAKRVGIQPTSTGKGRAATIWQITGPLVGKWEENK